MQTLATFAVLSLIAGIGHALRLPDIPPFNITRVPFTAADFGPRGAPVGWCWNSTGTQKRALQRPSGGSHPRPSYNSKRAAQEDQTDIVIAGGGTAACAAAYRLALLRPDLRVTVLEQGGDDQARMDQVVGFWLTQVYPPTDQNLRDFRVPFVNTDNVISFEDAFMAYRGQNLFGGKVAGGGSRVNGNLFCRPSEANLNKWNSALWTWNATNADWNAVVADMTCAVGDPDCVRTGGIVTQPFPLDSYMNAAMLAMASQFNLTVLPNLQRRVNNGIGSAHRNLAVDPTSGQPIRQDSWSRLLRPILVSHPNVKMITSARVTGIEVKSNGQHTVTYVRNGDTVRLRAHRKVILSAGPTRTPQILQLSGIGDCTALASKFGIACQVNNSEVGNSFHAETMTGGVYLSNVGPPPDLYAGLGAVVTAIYNDPLTGYAMEDSFTPIVLPSAAGLQYVLVHEETQLAPFLSGTVRLRSADPLDDPYVQTHIYNNPSDALAMGYMNLGVRKALLGLSSGVPNIPLFTELSPGPILAPNATPQQQIAAVLQTAISAHFFGGAVMGKVVDERTRLLDGQGRVVRNINIMDTSIVPVHLGAYAETHSACALGVLTGTRGAALLTEDLNAEDAGSH